MPRGGKREGAGRPKGSKDPHTFSKEAERERLRQLLTLKMEPVAEALVSRAMGVRYFVTRNGKTGKFELVTDPEQVVAALNKEDGQSGEFYTDKPDTAAIREFFDRTVDKSKEQPQEVNMNVTGGMEIIQRVNAGRERIAKAKRGQ